MFGEHFQLNEQTIPVVEEIGRHMPGGFFIYRADAPGELLYANRAVIDIFGCDDLDDFKNHTGYTFKGMLHPDDYDEIIESVNKQISTSDDNFDYVEYRIIRKDGSVRWVDDYGHYTDTEAYGGIYYVFISDITEKKMRLESDMAVRQAVIEALSESYRTVWLIRDVESESFSLYSGDSGETTFQALPIREALGQIKYSDAKDHYIKTTVSETDRDRLSEMLTLDKIVKRLNENPQYNVNYLRLMEDGSERYFRIEFAKVNMPGGKMGIVCGFKDVDDEVRIQMKESETRRKELEERLRLQEKIIEDKKQNAEQDKLITALASDFKSVYYVVLDIDEGVCYQSHPDIEDALAPGERFVFSQKFNSYAQKNITDDYREEFLRFIEPDSIREGLRENRVISFRYMVDRDGACSYEMIRFAGVRHPESRDDHIVHAVSACFADVDEETRKSLAQNRTLSDALEAAEQANRAKTAFLSNMSHEIRTPMNAIIGLDNIALSDIDISDRTKDYLEKIGTSAHHLLGIINDILDMSRIESGRMVINSEEFSFSRMMDQVTAIIGGQCHNKGLNFDYEQGAGLLDYYIGDNMKLKQVLINILGNSVKFTPAGGRVILRVEKQAEYEGNSTLKFMVRDTGIGMSKEYLPRIFEAFTQEDSSSTSRYGSTGLGMPITKNLVELMNGTIEVESEKGVGTTFTVTIPLKDSDRKDSDTSSLDISPHEMSVLVIDDDPVACEHARLVLGQVGIGCDTALSGSGGIEMVKLRHARREPYNLILVDWKMPEMDGIETTRQIRQIVGAESAIIFLTSFNWDDVTDEAKEAGIDSFVAKPLLASSVLDEFKTAFKNKNHSEEDKEISLAGRRVLLAEDVAINAEIMTMVLSMREIAVDHAENGKLAVEMFENHEPGYYDAILMDMRMPEMDGLEATKVIRSMNREDSERIPIIALTANAFDEDVQRSLQAGLNAHLSKPVEPDALYETLTNLIN